jgi:hypothetical protein
MPEYKIPVGCGSLLLESDAGSVDGDHDKTELSSLRSSSPKSAASLCTDDLSSVVSDGPSEDASEQSAAILADLSEEEEGGNAAAASPYNLEEDLEASLSLSEVRAEELMAQGADMRHVLCTSWKLQPKMEVGMRLRKAATAASVGRLGQQTLRDATTVQKKAIQVKF